MERKAMVTAILDKYLKNCKTIAYDDISEENSSHVRWLTSMEIRENVSQMMTLELDEVTEYMLEHQYDCINESGDLTWLIDDENETITC